MPSVGIVCEGSHDFAFLAPVIDEILKGQGHQQNEFHALQPRVDATSMQMDGGGYEAVRQWLLNNSGAGFDKFFGQPLFRTSQTYDFIVVQLDGDVADISIDFKASAFANFANTVPDRVNAVDAWIRSMASLSSNHSSQLLTAIPTLEMEAWILAALRPGRQNIECRTRKRTVKRILNKRYTGNAVQQVKAAGAEACQAIPSVLAGCQSFSHFHQQLLAI